MEHISRIITELLKSKWRGREGVGVYLFIILDKVIGINRLCTVILELCRHNILWNVFWQKQNCLVNELLPAALNLSVSP